jgi:signal transduction histidine kinase
MICKGNPGVPDPILPRAMMTAADHSAKAARPPARALFARRELRVSTLLALAILLMAAGAAVTIGNLRGDLAEARRQEAILTVCSEAAQLLALWDEADLIATVQSRAAEARRRGSSLSFGFVRRGDLNEAAGTFLRPGARLERSFACTGLQGEGWPQVETRSQILTGPQGRVVAVTLSESWSETIGGSAVNNEQQVQVAYGVDASLRQTDAQILQASLIALAGMLAAGGLAAWFYLRFSGGIARVNAALAAVNDGQWTARASVPGDLRELRLLAEQTNAALERIESQMRLLAVSGSRIGHDLIDPLARIRMRLERAGMDPAAAQDILARIDTVIATSRALLDILRGGTLEVGPLDLSQAVAALAEDLAGLLDETRFPIAVQIARGVMIVGNADVLQALFANLAHNIERHAAPGPVGVTLSLDPGGGSFRLTIANAAPGTAQPATRRYGLGTETMRIAALSMGFGLTTRVTEGRFEAIVTGPCAAAPAAVPDGLRTT